MLPDIYFEPSYAKIHQSMYEGAADSFVYEDEDGKIMHSFLRREIPNQLNGVTYYDLITPYGYGGPIITELRGNKNKLINKFQLAYRDYCTHQNIVSEFIRFHPLIKNHVDFSEIFNTSFMRHTVATDLSKEDPFLEEFSKGARKTTRQALNKGFTWELVQNPIELDVFKKVYTNTMQRHNASEFYFFGDKYFNQLLKNLKDHLLNINIYKGDLCVASGLYFYYKDYMHAHLSGTHQDFLNENPAYVLKYLSVKWGKEHGCKYIHYGGGTTNDPQDSLLLFKKRFTKESVFDFYVAKNIYHQKVYDLLTEDSGILESSFFPSYRDPKRAKDD